VEDALLLPTRPMAPIPRMSSMPYLQYRGCISTVTSSRRLQSLHVLHAMKNLEDIGDIGREILLEGQKVRTKTKANFAISLKT